METDDHFEMDQPPVHVLDLNPDDLQSHLVELFGPEIPSYRAKQIFEWVYRHRIHNFAEMTNLPRSIKELLDLHFCIYASSVVQNRPSNDGTRKLLLRWPDGATSECVLIPTEDRRTACLSAQVGCPVQCVFCASGVGGLDRNLTTGQIVEQALRLIDLCPDETKLTNIVFMGIGEPLANYDAVIGAIRILHAPWGMGLGARRLTVSTIGLPQPIRKLAQEGLPINLAWSLHAPNDTLRRQLIPWAAKIPLDEVIDACRYFFETTGREVTLEYLVLDGVNHRPEHAEQLARIASAIRANVNLIPYNPVAGLGFARPDDAVVMQFEQRLRRLGVNVHVRHSRGLDIDAACGQLRRQNQNPRS